MTDENARHYREDGSLREYNGSARGGMGRMLFGQKAAAAPGVPSVTSVIPRQTMTDEFDALPCVECKKVTQRDDQVLRGSYLFGCVCLLCYEARVGVTQPGAEMPADYRAAWLSQLNSLPYEQGKYLSA
jgi:hypothetical protein